jgi:hypothetical protein
LDDILIKINDKYVTIFHDLFSHINHENTSEHASRRFKLLTNQNIGLNFVQGNFEINPLITNLIIIFKELFSIKYLPEFNDTESTVNYFNSIIKYVNNNDIKIDNIIININNDIINIKTEKEIMTIELQHFKHAIIPNTKNKINILQIIRQDPQYIIEDLKKFKYNSYYEITNHLLLTSIIYNNKNDRWMNYLINVHKAENYIRKKS